MILDEAQPIQPYQFFLVEPGGCVLYLYGQYFSTQRIKAKDFTIIARSHADIASVLPERNRVHLTQN